MHRHALFDDALMSLGSRVHAWWLGIQSTSASGEFASVNKDFGVFKMAYTVHKISTWQPSFRQEKVQGSSNSPACQVSCYSYFSRTNESLIHVTNYTLTQHPVTYPSVQAPCTHVCVILGAYINCRNNYLRHSDFDFWHYVIPWYWKHEVYRLSEDDPHDTLFSKNSIKRHDKWRDAVEKWKHQ